MPILLPRQGEEGGRLICKFDHNKRSRIRRAHKSDKKRRETPYITLKEYQEKDFDVVSLDDDIAIRPVVLLHVLLPGLGRGRVEYLGSAQIFYSPWHMVDMGQGLNIKPLRYTYLASCIKPESFNFPIRY